MATDITTCAEPELIDAARLGNAEAFTILYERYVDRVYRLVSWRLGRTAEAEDVTQQAFVNAWQALGRYRQTEVPFVAWLLKIAHNACISQLRATRFSVELNEAVDHSDGHDVADEVLLDEQRQVVLAALDRLEGEQAQAVWMRYMEDLSYAEIAAQLDKPVENVRLIMHRGLRKLRGYLER